VASVLLVVTIILVWSMIWIVPVSLAIKRRKKNKPIYWFLLLSALFVELFMTLVCMQVSLWINYSILGAYISPLIGAIAGGYLYQTMAMIRDRRDDTI